VSQGSSQTQEHYMPFDEQTKKMIAHILGNKVSQFNIHPTSSNSAKLDPRENYKFGPYQD